MAESQDANLVIITSNSTQSNSTNSPSNTPLDQISPQFNQFSPKLTLPSSASIDQIPSNVETNSLLDSISSPSSAAQINSNLIEIDPIENLIQLTTQSIHSASSDLNNPSSNAKSDQNSAHINPQPVLSGLANAKKFKASSLSVNKKFLSQSSTTDSKSTKSNYSSSPRLSNLTSSSSPSLLGPRLITGKIASNCSIINPGAPGASGWAKTSLVIPSIPLSAKSPELSHPTLPFAKPGPQSPLPNRDDLTTIPKTGLNAFLQASSAQFHPTTNNLTLQSAHPSSSSSSTTTTTSTTTTSPWSRFGNSAGSGVDNLSMDFPTAQEVAQHTKMKAQSMAAAIAARDKANQERAAASAAYNQQLLQTLDGFRGTHLDPNASHWDEMEDEDDMFGEVVEFGDGTQYKVTELVPPANEPTSSIPIDNNQSSTTTSQVSKRDRFAEDYDRTVQQPNESTEHMPPFLRGRAEMKSLFNEQIGKFEPYSGKRLDKTVKESSPQVQLLQRQPDGSNDISNSSVRTNEQSLAEADFIDKSINTSHPAQSSNQNDLKLENALSTTRTSLSQPLSSLKPSPTSSTSPASVKTSNGNLASDKPDSYADSPKYKKPDLDQFHRSEMLSAAERARKRRQEEEEAREAERERARQKALEIEAKLKAASTESSNKLTLDPQSCKPTSPNHTPTHSQQNNTIPSSLKDLDSWRSRPPQADKLEAPPQSVTDLVSPNIQAKSNLIQANNEPQLETSRLSTKVECSKPPESKLSPTLASLRASTPLPPQEDVFKSREESSNQPTPWKPSVLSKTSSAQFKSHEAASRNSVQQSVDSQKNNENPNKQVPTSESSRPQSLVVDLKGPNDPDSRQITSQIRHANNHSSEPPKSLLSTISVSTSSLVPKVAESTTASTYATKLPQSSSSITNITTSSPVHRVALVDKKPPYKLPEMSHLDTVMSRIKGVLEADKEVRAKAVAAAAAAATDQSISSTVTQTQKSPSAPSALFKTRSISTPVLSTYETVNKSGQDVTSISSIKREEASKAVYVPGHSRALLPRTIEPSPGQSAISQNKPPSTSVNESSELKLFSSNKSSLPKTPSVPNLTPAILNPALRKPSTIRKAARFDIPFNTDLKSTLVSTPTRSSKPIALSSSAWVNRDPIVFFDATRQERPSSPEPAWKAYSIKFGAVKPKPRLAPQLVKAFWNPLVHSKVNVLTWDPPLANLSPRTLSRDDLLFRKKYIRGIVVSNVHFPKRRIVHATRQDKVLSAVKDGNSTNTLPNSDLPRDGVAPLFMRGRGRGSGSLQSSFRGRGRGRADETISWRRPIEEKVSEPPPPTNSTESRQATLSASDQVCISPQESSGSKSPELTTSRRTKSKLPDGFKVGFNRPANVSCFDSTTSGMFMVSSEITGESALLSSKDNISHSMSPKRVGQNNSSLENPTMLLTPCNRPSASSPAGLAPPSSNIPSITASKGSPSPWTKSSLAFSVLDSHTKNVWSQPDGQLTGKPAPSGKTENSLEGIADDFPAALPRTLNDFNAEEEPNLNSKNQSFDAHETRQYGHQSRASNDISGAPTEQEVGNCSTHLQTSSSNAQDDRQAPNGLASAGYMNSTTVPTHHSNENSATASAHLYPPNYSSPSNFQVPPGYQLVPIGSLQSNQTAQYPPPPALYSGQAPAPWSPSLTSIPPNGYARSPQLYSLNTTYSPQVTASGYPSHAHSPSATQVSNSGGFAKSPGPIAPRGGSRGSSASIHNSHLSRQSNESGFAPTLNQTNGNYLNGKIQTNPTMGPGYHSPGGSLEGPPGQHNNAYGGNFAPFHPAQAHNVVSNIHPSQQPAHFNPVVHGPGGIMSPQGSYSPSVVPPTQISNNMFPPLGHGPSPQPAHMMNNNQTPVPHYLPHPHQYHQQVPLPGSGHMAMNNMGFSSSNNGNGGRNGAGYLGHNHNGSGNGNRIGQSGVVIDSNGMYSGRVLNH
ncbi:hypothetical protein O181_026851 [Austropuccinia psidii MF-1]|uniref:Uncharacterized protein n=1 Tax=Austropuccinia psidii MF-1 TaxID=1389203 RepID=A0A9Q3H0W3_9BASI|nr:hypothetical protein [Austropuccinia psidii MF-1]